ncbi:hypothetical protein [Acetobacter okinawensis]|uniref:hypothetical protein n=1 Tax=Acetobacter okinawensis TaxID=1076594 RepID=UPI0015D8D531|nr:hypothetical protein [Acetobacter okinawensis]
MFALPCAEYRIGFTVRRGVPEYAGRQGRGGSDARVSLSLALTSPPNCWGVKTGMARPP